MYVRQHSDGVTALSVSILLTSSPGTTGRAPGLLLLSAGVVMLIPAAVASLGKLVSAVVLATASLRYICTGVWEMTGSNQWKTIAGIVGLALAAIALYAATAAAYEAATKREVLPMGRRGRGLVATQGDMDQQLIDLRHEPGVRQQL
jgi:uncharacterized protein